MYQLGKILADQKQWEQAEDHLKAAISLRGKHADTRYYMGKVLMASGNDKEAIKEFKKAVKLDKKNPAYLLSLGNGLIEAKKLGQGLNNLLKAAKIEPESHAIAFSVCNVYSKKRFFSNAVTQCERALKLNPDDYPTMNRLAWLYAKKKIHLKKGLKLSQKTLEAFPDKAEYIDTVSELHYAAGNVEKAVENIQAAIKLVPDEPYYKQQLWRFKNVKPPVQPVARANKNSQPQNKETKS